MATKNPRKGLLLGWVVLLLWGHGIQALTDEEEFKVRRDYLKSRYEDFFLHYDFVDQYEHKKNRGGELLRGERLKQVQEKDQSRRDYLKVRKLPGPYREIEDGTGNKEDQKKKDLARKEFIEKRSALRRLEKNVQKIPPEIDSGLEDLED